MTRRAACPGLEGAPYAELASGWPYGRVRCLTCGAYVFPTAAGALRRHVPDARPTAWELERRAELERARA